MENWWNDSGVSDPRTKDLDDLQNEIAGRETGRRKRFLVGGEASPDEQRRKREAEQALKTKLALMLADPVYRARYDGVMDDLRQAEQATEAALGRIADKIEETENAIQDMEDRAARLPDGTLVFRDASGNVRRTDGSVVDQDLAATILWTGNEPGFEDYRAQVDLRDALHADQRDVEQYQTDVLGTARDRLTDETNPAALEELDEIANDIRTRMPDSVRSQGMDAARADPISPDLETFTLPDLGTRP